MDKRRVSRNSGTRAWGRVACFRFSGESASNGSRSGWPGRHYVSGAEDRPEADRSRPWCNCPGSPSSGRYAVDDSDALHPPRFGAADLTLPRRSRNELTRVSTHGAHSSSTGSKKYEYRIPATSPSCNSFVESGAPQRSRSPASRGRKSFRRRARKSFKCRARDSCRTAAIGYGRFRECTEQAVQTNPESHPSRRASGNTSRRGAASSGDFTWIRLERSVRAA